MAMKDFIDAIIAFESGELDEDEAVELLQGMVDDGSIWKLQGSHGRLAADLLEQGVLKFPKERTHDYYGNPILTRDEWAATHPPSELPHELSCATCGEEFCQEHSDETAV
jgi:hypothetical protein